MSKKKKKKLKFRNYSNFQKKNDFSKFKKFLKIKKKNNFPKFSKNEENIAFCNKEVIEVVLCQIEKNQNCYQKKKNLKNCYKKNFDWKKKKFEIQEKIIFKENLLLLKIIEIVLNFKKGIN